MQYKYDKDIIKETLTIEQVYDLVEELGGEPKMQNGYFIAKTLCHNHIGEGSHKLYYYDNSKLFKCYTECDDTFDIFELILKIQHIKQENNSFSLFNAIEYIASYFGFIATTASLSLSDTDALKDWQILSHYEKNNNKAYEQPIIQFKQYDKTILQKLPFPHILPWEKEGISRKVMDLHLIRYDPSNQGIVIPHFDIDNNLIGIRERTLIIEEEKNGKYRPAILNNIMYNHPLGFSLYNLNYSKNNIRLMKKVVAFEGEKSALKYASYFGMENDISVAVCGSSLIKHQVDLLLSLGVNEIIIAFDKQFQHCGDEEWKKWTKKLEDIYKKYNSYCLVSFMFDKANLLKYKESPIDEGKEIFLQLFKERILL